MMLLLEEKLIGNLSNREVALDMANIIIKQIATVLIWKS
jgi:hypothetical protein